MTTSFKCPRCGEHTISIKEKYRIGWWLSSTCSECGARVVAFPWTLMVLFFFYVWNVVWWTGLIHFNDSYHYLIYMVICWVLLDLANIFFMPMSSLKQKTTQQSDGH